MKIRLILYAALGVGAIAALAWALTPRPVEVEVVAVQRGRFEDAIEEDGRTRVRDRYVVSAPVTARLSRITLREGDRVEAGDTVAVLMPVMPALFDQRSQLEVRARAKTAQAAVAAAQARMESARIAQDEARSELQRTERLAKEGFVALSRLDSAQHALDGTRREFEAALAARDMAVHEREQAQASIVRNPGATVRVEPLAVLSPHSGVVLRVPNQSETTVTSGTALIDIGDPAQMEVVADLLTADAVRAKPGTRAVIERWGGPPVEGRVRRVEPSAFTKISALGIEEQRVRTVIDMTSPPAEWRALGDAFRVTARLVTVSTDDAILVPVGALFPDAAGAMKVYVLEGGRARVRAVEINARNGSVGWVRQGLSADERVIVYPPPGVADGRRVRVKAP